jgi:hypothetical protein
MRPYGVKRKEYGGYCPRGGGKRCGCMKLLLGLKTARQFVKARERRKNKVRGRTIGVY